MSYPVTYFPNASLQLSHPSTSFPGSLKPSNRATCIVVSTAFLLSKSIQSSAGLPGETANFAYLLVHCASTAGSQNLANIHSPVLRRGASSAAPKTENVVENNMNAHIQNTVETCLSIFIIHIIDKVRFIYTTYLIVQGNFFKKLLCVIPDCNLVSKKGRSAPSFFIYGCIGD